MLREKDEVMVINPVGGHEFAKNKIGLIIRVNHRWFAKTKFKILFKDLDVQKYNKIGMFEFYEEELKRV